MNLLIKCCLQIKFRCYGSTDMLSLVSYNGIIYEVRTDGDKHGSSSGLRCKNYSFLLVIALCLTYGTRHR